MLGRLFNRNSTNDIVSSQLYNEHTFYRAFMRDLSLCESEAIIESPFITSNRVASLLPIFRKMRSRGVRVVVNTRHPAEHNAPYDTQAQVAIEQMQQLGAEILFTGNHHRKLAIFDQQVLWEGSLNILSQNDSCEVMRRIESQYLAEQMINFTQLRKFTNKTKV
jgi:phosphatidylserine/phosphatidylglycerophosphate/cardiolipin synthase-like enzyme